MTVSTMESFRAPDSSASPAHGPARLGGHPTVGWVAAVVISAGFALASAWITPRGPGTTAAALTTGAVAMVVGLAIGFLTASRGSLLLGPVTFMVVFELARLSSVGPTVDAPDFGSFYGLLAFVLGRGVHGLVALTPMVLGCGLGIWFAGRSGSGDQTRPGLGWILGALAMAVVMVYVALPASTAPLSLIHI